VSGDDLTDDERAALVAAARKVIADDKFPRSPRLDALQSALAKLDPACRDRVACRALRHL
jgi:hypothetical protein